MRVRDGGGGGNAVRLQFHGVDCPDSGKGRLYWYSGVKSKRLASLLQKEVLSVLGTRNRGIKPRTRGDRGSHLLRKTRMPCVIVEPFFGSNTADWDKGVARKGDLVKAYFHAIERYF